MAVHRNLGKNLPIESDTDQRTIVAHVGQKLIVIAFSVAEAPALKAAKLISTVLGGTSRSMALSQWT